MRFEPDPLKATVEYGQTSGGVGRRGEARESE
jgi:hypothetical protein